MNVKSLSFENINTGYYETVIEHVTDVTFDGLDKYISNKVKLNWIINSIVNFEGGFLILYRKPIGKLYSEE